mgnify:FL=1
MKLYHGSNIAIEKIDLSKGRPAKDFGRGFYLSDDKGQASSMANNIVNRKGGKPVVSVFDCPDDILTCSDLKVMRFDGYSEQWLDFILENRANRSLVQAHDYDVVYGPIANDAVAVSIALYTDEFINKKELLGRLKYRHETFQYFFATEKAISKLTVSNE